jgi:hypothetical protein
MAVEGDWEQIARTELDVAKVSYVSWSEKLYYILFQETTSEDWES